MLLNVCFMFLSHFLGFRILNDDFPGVFSFEKRGYFVKESCGHVAIVIVRENGADGDVEAGAKRC